MSVNPESATPAQGEFRSKVAPSKPLTTKGVRFSQHLNHSLTYTCQHAPGVLVGNDAKPEFRAEQYTPGTAPPEHSFEPQTSSEYPTQAPGMEGGVSASDTLQGATSADVHTGLGHPGSGMTSQEEHGGKRKKVGAGLEGVGASLTDPIHDKGADREHETDYRGKGGEAAANYPGAEERVAASAEEVASERR
ncbi:hypothetical protein NW754_015439 [Fusarium falciforme]|nr:hypothetical protein NW754_015439 [Fusarium falciforme]